MSLLSGEQKIAYLLGTAGISSIDDIFSPQPPYFSPQEPDEPMTAEEEELLEVESFYRDLVDGLGSIERQHYNVDQEDALFWEYHDEALKPRDPVENRPLIPVVEQLSKTDLLASSSLLSCVMCDTYVANTRILPCGHAVACVDCMARWRAAAPWFTCPNCRATIETVEPNLECLLELGSKRRRRRRRYNRSPDKKRKSTP